MNIEILSSLKVENNVSLEDLFSHLAKSVAMKTDEKIKAQRQQLMERKKLIQDSSKKLSDLKKIVELEKSKYTQKKALKRVLSLIKTLNKEGLLGGKNRQSVYRLLSSSIEKKDFNQLRKLEENLTLLLPDR